MKILIIRFSSIGDIVLTTPVVRCLKQQVPAAEIHYLTKASFTQVIAANPYVDKFHYLEHSLQSVIRELKQEKFDCIIDLHNNLRTGKVKEALKVKSFVVNKLNLGKWLLTSLKINILPDIHIVDRYLKTVESFGVKNDGAGLDYFTGKSEILEESDIPTSHSAGYVGLVIGAALHTKQYPVHHWKEVCRQLDHPVILLGGLEDAHDGDAIATIDPVKVYNSCGKFSLNESALLLKRAKLVVSNDTGLMHIAAAMRKPLISLWGNTVPAFGMYPYYGEKYLNSISAAMPYDIMETKGLGCRPCSKIGYDSCPRGHFKCMEEIDPSDVVARIRARLAMPI